jgi:hypothetical protein
MGLAAAAPNLSLALGLHSQRWSPLACPRENPEKGLVADAQHCDPTTGRRSLLVSPRRTTRKPPV